MLRTTLLALAALALPALAASAGSPARFSGADNGRTVTLHVGDRFTVALKENSTTGYSWKVVSSGEPAVKQVGQPTFKTDSSLHGAGGTVTYRFRAAAEGTGALELVYVRPWQKDAAPEATFKLTVVVAK